MNGFETGEFMEAFVGENGPPDPPPPPVLQRFGPMLALGAIAGLIFWFNKED